MTLRCGARSLDLSCPRVMGILNVTPDSFSDGGTLYVGGRVSLDAVEDRAGAMLDEGAAILDIGGESTRPGAASVEVSEELDRVIPVVERLRGFDTILSIDTSKPGVAAAAVGAGADFVNDVRAARSPGMLEVLSGCDAGVCLMHMQGEPRSMQDAPSYVDVVAEVRAFLAERVGACRGADVDDDRIVVDPGIGFGKTLEHNLAVLRRLDELGIDGLPILIGISRKRTLGKLTGRPVQQRNAAGIAAAVLAVAKGAAIIRTHDVGETVDALKVTDEVLHGT